MVATVTVAPPGLDLAGWSTGLVLVTSPAVGMTKSPAEIVGPTLLTAGAVGVDDNAALALVSYTVINDDKTGDVAIITLNGATRVNTMVTAVPGGGHFPSPQTVAAV